MRKAILLAMTVAAAIVTAPAATALFGMPEALTERGQVVGDLYNMIAALGLITFLIVFVWLVILIVRFREGTGHGKATHEAERHNLKAELAWTLVPLVMVLFIGYAAYGGLVTLDHGIPISDAEMEVKIEGTQWNWQFDYGNDVRLLANPSLEDGSVAVENTFLLPADTNILFNITGGDVIHAFQLLDANRAYVMFNDANPLGSNKYALQTANLPAGDYEVQCNKFCLNPGHAYMRATVKVVPEAEYNHWLAGKAAVANAGLVQSVPIQFTAGKLTGLEDLTLAATTRLVLDVQGPHGDITVEVGNRQRLLAATESVNTFLTFDFPTAGNFTLEVKENGQVVESVAVQVVAAKVVSIEMLNFLFKPASFDFEAGTTYLVQAVNHGESTHDATIGVYRSETDKEVLAKSVLVSPGATGSFLFTPATSGTYDLWCTPHATSGMLQQDSVHVH